MKRKICVCFTLMLMVLCTLFGKHTYVKADTKDETQQGKKGFEGNILYTDRVGVNINLDKESNNYLRYYFQKNNSSIKCSLLYENFYSGFTAIKINDETFLYGQGENIEGPYYDDISGQFISRQLFGMVEVTQIIQIVRDEKNNDDLVIVTYIANNKGESAEVGICCMEDMMFEKDDRCQLNIDKQDISSEYEMVLKNGIPEWYVTSKDNTIKYSAYSYEENKYDQIEFCNWDALYEKDGNYIADSSINIKDLAIAYVWDKEKLDSNSSITYTLVNKLDGTVEDTVSVEQKQQTPVKNKSVVTGDTMPIILLGVTALVAILFTYLLSRKKVKEER